MTTSSEHQTNTAGDYWPATYDTLYNCWYEELASEALLARWELIDTAIAALTAITSSGSAVAGWTLWSNASGKFVWAVLAGLASLAAISHTALRVPARIRQQEELHRSFGALRVDLETFAQLLNQLTGGERITKYQELRQRFALARAQTRPCIAYTRVLREAVQHRLDNLLKAKGYI